MSWEKFSYISLNLIIAIILLWLCASFVQWDLLWFLDLGTWSKDDRIGAIVMFLCTFGIAVLITL